MAAAAPAAASTATAASIAPRFRSAEPPAFCLPLAIAATVRRSHCVRAIQVAAQELTADKSLSARVRSDFWEAAQTARHEVARLISHPRSSDPPRLDTRLRSLLLLLRHVGDDAQAGKVALAAFFP